MIYYYIPDFFWHYHVNLRLLELIRDFPDMFYDDFKIGAVFGNFPNCIWDGGRSFHGRYTGREEQAKLSEAFNSFGVPLRLTMTNILLKDTDLYDRYSNYIMSNLNNGYNQVLVASDILEDHIRSKYPEYNVVRSILSSTSSSLYDDTDRYYLSVLSTKKNNDLEFLQSIDRKDKIELLVNEQCMVSCGMFDHYKGFCRNQLLEDNQGEELQLSCTRPNIFPRRVFYKHPLCITRDKIKDIYEPMGFKHFKIQGRGSHGSVILDYAHYMVKPEWREDFIHTMMDSIVFDNR